MTFVAARRFGKKVIIVADTMLTDLDGTRHSVIPGQLKIIVMSPTLTIAFAGLEHQSLDAIRDAKQCLSAGASIVEIEQLLAGATSRIQGKVEFLVVNHVDGEPTLKRIWEGRVSDDLPQTCIGERDLLDVLLVKEAGVPLGYRPHESEQESQFIMAFHRLFDGTKIAKAVGGFPIVGNCSPFGHCYNGFSGVAAWDEITFPLGVTEEQLADRRAGKTQWSFNVQDTKYRGVAVLGAIVLDAGVGYIYSPLEDDTPVKWTFAEPATQTEYRGLLEQFVAALEEKSQSLGGVIIDDAVPVERRLSASELEEVYAYAAAAPVPTAITLRTDGLWIACGKPYAMGSLLGYFGLEDEPVLVVKTVIDRMNAEMLQRTS